MMEKYIVTKDADMLAPNWLADRIDYKSVNFLYGIHDGAEILKVIHRKAVIQISPVETQGDASYFIVFFRET